MSRQTLFRRFLRHPGRVGALWPSSPSLCRMMVSRIGVEQAKLVVELGPGTGVITPGNHPDASGWGAFHGGGA